MRSCTMQIPSGESKRKWHFGEPKMFYTIMRCNRYNCTRTVYPPIHSSLLSFIVDLLHENHSGKRELRNKHSAQFNLFLYRLHPN